MQPTEELLLIGMVGIGALVLMDAVNSSGVVSVSDATGDSSGDASSFDGSEIVTTNMSTPGKLMQFADAIFHFEGGNPGNLNVRNNNPGNLKFAEQPGATQGANGFAVFSTMDQGWSALYAQLNKTVGEFPQLNLQQFFARYLGQSDFINPRATDQGNPFTYAQSVADKLGVSPTDSLSTIFGGNS